MKTKRLLFCFALSAFIFLAVASVAFADDEAQCLADSATVVDAKAIQINTKDAEVIKYDANGLIFYAVNLEDGEPFELKDFKTLNNYMEQLPFLYTESASKATTMNWVTNHTWSKDKYNDVNPNCLVYSSGTGQRASSSVLYYIRSKGGVASSAILGSTQGLHTITETYSSTSLGVSISWPPTFTISGNTASVSTPPTNANSVYYYRENIEASSLQTVLVLNITTTGMVGLNGSFYPTSVSDRVRYMD